MELKGKGEPVYDGDHQLIWPKSIVFDITKLAFPNRKLHSENGNNGLFHSN